MTFKERAEKIHSETCGAEDPRPIDACIAWIADEIREATEEAIDRHVADQAEMSMDDLWAEAAESERKMKAEAYEDAAKIAEHYCINGDAYLDPACAAASDIRTRAKEPK